MCQTIYIPQKSKKEKSPESRVSQRETRQMRVKSAYPSAESASFQMKLDIALIIIFPFQSRPKREALAAAALPQGLRASLIEALLNISDKRFIFLGFCNWLNNRRSMFRLRKMQKLRIYR
jgi:hypothetical protein